ncbi:MAG: hypothetical protein K0S07_379 [Chlamydiales bacterium]|jgi:hypothetical protein|nr:hypothetical protein [Chlamydiales bacterium]
MLASVKPCLTVISSIWAKAGEVVQEAKAHEQPVGPSQPKASLIIRIQQEAYQALQGVALVLSYSALGVALTVPVAILGVGLTSYVAIYEARQAHLKDKNFRDTALTILTASVDIPATALLAGAVSGAAILVFGPYFGFLKATTPPEIFEAHFPWLKLSQLASQ